VVSDSPAKIVAHPGIHNTGIAINAPHDASTNGEDTPIGVRQVAHRPPRRK
jgi:hypothetical protein